jgi:hypothetical protein
MKQKHGELAIPPKHIQQRTAAATGTVEHIIQNHLKKQEGKFCGKHFNFLLYTQQKHLTGLDNFKWYHSINSTIFLYD